MNCEQALPQVELLPLGLIEAPERAALQAHLAGCAACQATAQALQAAYAAQADEVEQVVSAPLTGEARARALAAAMHNSGESKESGMLAKKTVHPPGPAVDPARIEAVAQRINLACSYCHAAATRAELVYCATCLGPHHEECFRTHGRCSLAGCQETEVVRPTPSAPAPARPRPLGKVLLLAAAVLVPGAVAAERWSVWSLQARTDHLQAQVWQRERAARLASEEQQAHDETPAPRVTLRFEQGSLRAVVDELRRQVDVNLLLDPRAEQPVTIDVREVTWRQAAEELARRAGCELQERAPGLFVLMLEEGASLSAVNCEAREVFRLLSRPTRNVLVGPDVQGRCTLELRNVRWSDALLRAVEALGTRAWSVGQELIYVSGEAPPGGRPYEPASSADLPEDQVGPRVDLDLREVPLPEACARLAEASGRRIELKGAHRLRAPAVTIRVSSAPWRAVLRILAEWTDCDLERRGDEAALCPAPRVESLALDGATLGGAVSLLAFGALDLGASLTAGPGVVVGADINARRVDVRLYRARIDDALRAVLLLARCQLDTTSGVVHGLEGEPVAEQPVPAAGTVVLEGIMHVNPAPSPFGVILVSGQVHDSNGWQVGGCSVSQERSYEERVELRISPFRTVVLKLGESVEAGRLAQAAADSMQPSFHADAGPLLPADLPRAGDHADAGWPASGSPTGTPAGAWLGLATREDGGRLFVDDVSPGSPAAVAGVQRDDRLVALRLPLLDQPEPLTVPLARLEDLTGALRALTPGVQLTLVVERAGQELRLECEVGERPR